MNDIKHRLSARFEEETRLAKEVSTVRLRGKTERQLEVLKDLVMEKAIAGAQTGIPLE